MRDFRYVGVDGRATTPEQKRAVVERLYRAWLDNPYQRLGQFIDNAIAEPGVVGDMFYVEDDEMVRAVVRYDP